jgi:hypothetical protein
MDTTLDFHKWLVGAQPEGYEEPYSLFRAVNNGTSFGIYNVKRLKGSGDRWIVTAPHLSVGLLLASMLAKESFLLHLTRTYCRDLDMESWYGYMHSMSKND